MNKINLKLYQACIAKRKRMQDIASMAGIEKTRFSKILNGKLRIRVEEKRILSKVLGVAQKDLF